MEDKLKIMRLAVANIALDSTYIYFHLKANKMEPENLGLDEMDFYRLGLCKVPMDEVGWKVVWEYVLNKKTRC